ncbi:hypothetical protein GBA52_023927 [Prunus armeniaca]|nr:hypothetical protein GBA52_023927 [Prunus armeniaca]
MEDHSAKLVLVTLLLSLVSVVLCATDPNDLAILNQFRKNMENPELLKWPENGEDPCGDKWEHVFCDDQRVSQIQVQNLGLKGPLPQNFNQLTELTNIGLQRNKFSGPLPSLKGLSKLRYAYLDFNDFSSIPVDFFDGLDALEVLALDSNNLNATSGWTFPPQLANSAQLKNISCMSCNLVGPLPDFLGNLSSLTVLQLSGNGLTGEFLELNSVWLHGNQFTGTIPESIGNLTSLKDLNLNQNQLVGLVPDSLANLALGSLNLNNNHLMGPIPKFKAQNVTFTSNSFCQSTPGLPCAPEVMALVEFLDGLNYPSTLVSKWSGNDPCGSWLGVSCGNNGKVSVINLPKYNLNGTLSPSVAKLDSLVQIRLQNNNLRGSVPDNWTSLKSLTVLDLSGNNISPPLPKFSKTINVAVDDNPLFHGNPSAAAAAPENSPSSANNSSSSSTGSGSHVNGTSQSTQPKGSKRASLVLIVAPVTSVAVIAALLVIPLSMYYCKKRRDAFQTTSSLVIHPRDPSDSDNMVKVVVASNTNGSASTVTGSGSASRNSSGIGESHVIEAGNLIISVQACWDFWLLSTRVCRPEESQYLAAWFWHIKSNKEKLMAAIDPALDQKEETFESIATIAELAGHCTAREPSQRPDMGHAVNVLSPLVEKWKPLDDENEEYSGIDYSLPLTQMVKGWQEAEGKDSSYLDLEDSKGSIPARPTGFAESFTSADGR